MKLNLRSKENQATGSILLLLLLILFFALYDRGILTGENPRDTRRMKDMTTIIAALESYGLDHDGVFPESLDVLSNERYLSKVYTDPVTTQPYKYVFDTEGNYSVCTNVVNHTQKCLFTNAKKIGI